MLNGISVNISQAQVQNLVTNLAATEKTVNKGVANGYASLDSNGLLPTSQLPPLSIADVNVVSSQAAMLALADHVGDICVRTDISETFVLAATPASTLANWVQVLVPFPVTSVNGHTGNVTLASTDLSDTALLARLANTALTGSTTAAALFVSGQVTLNVATGTAPLVVTSTTPVANLTLASASQVTGLAASATADTTNASNITSGTLAPARIASNNTITYSATPTLAVTGNSNTITLAGTPTTVTFPAGADGQEINIFIIQDATGGHSWPWPSNVRGGGTVDTTANTLSVQGFTYILALASWVSCSVMQIGL